MTKVGLWEESLGRRWMEFVDGVFFFLTGGLFWLTDESCVLPGWVFLLLG